jgi:L-iditol 2-dehydrogenase/threonine 3-dehydrogenase
MCAYRGAHVLITDLSDFRLEKAKECGIEATSNASQEGLPEASQRVFGSQGFDVAFECAGAEASMSAAVESVNKGGAIVIVAVFQEKPPVDLAVIGDRELHLIGSLMYQHCDYEEAVNRIAAGDIRTGPLDSMHFPFERYLDAYHYIEHQGTKCLKVFVDL